MKAVAVSPRERKLQWIDLPEPRLERPTDVLLRVLDVGVCGTDKEICAFEYGTPPAGSDLLVLGHEALAEVVAVGPAVRDLRAGDLVVPMVRRPCSHARCVPCRSGRQDFCVTGEFTERGIRGAHGFMTEHVVEDASQLRPVPRALRDVAVLVEPLTIAQKALMQLDHIQQRLPWACRLDPAAPPADRSCRSAVVLGAGPVGLLGAMAFVCAGYRTTVYSREQEGGPKARVAASFGAGYVSSQLTPPDALGDRIGPVDVMYEAVGASRLAFEALSALGTNGAFVFTGVPGRKGRAEIDTDALMRALVLNNQVVLGTVNAGADAFAAAVDDLGRFVERFPAALAAMIGRHPVGAYRDLLMDGGPAIKNVLAFAG